MSAWMLKLFPKSFFSVFNAGILVSSLLIIYLIIRSSFINILSQITGNVRVNLSNCDELKNDLKTEYYLITEFLYSFSRCFGYILLLVVGLLSTKYINLVLILPAVSILAEGIIIGRLCRK